MKHQTQKNESYLLPLLLFRCSSRLFTLLGMKFIDRVENPIEEQNKRKEK